MISKINEHIVELYCYEQFKNGKEFIDIDNKKIKIIKKGYLNKFAGPDFLNFKVLHSDGHVYETDIEVEKELKNFFLHKHHLDNNYDNVKYIFVYEKGKIKRKYTQNVIELKNQIDKLSDEDITLLESKVLLNNYKVSLIKEVENVSYSHKLNLLIKYGLIRFDKKVNDLKMLIRRYGDFVALIIKVIETAGLTRNKKKFRFIAENINWLALKKRLETATTNYKKDILFSLFNQIFTNSYNESDNFDASDFLFQQSKVSFNYYKVYPNSFPTSRINYFIPVILKLLKEDNNLFFSEFFKLKKQSHIYNWFKSVFLFDKYNIKIQNLRIKSLIYNALFPYFKIKYNEKLTNDIIFNFPKITKYSIIEYPLSKLNLNSASLKEIHSQGLLYLCI